MPNPTYLNQKEGLQNLNQKEQISPKGMDKESPVVIMTILCYDSRLCILDKISRHYAFSANWWNIAPEGVTRTCLEKQPQFILYNKT